MFTIRKILNNKILITILILLAFLILLPFFEVLVKIIFAYGNYVGTYARYIFEGKICLGLF